MLRKTPAATPSVGRLLTRLHVAQALEVSVRSVDLLIATGRLRVVRPLGLDVVRVEPDELARFIEESRSSAAGR